MAQKQRLGSLGPVTISGVVQPATPQPLLRYAEISDLAAVAAMHQRCSPASRYRRYMSGVAIPSHRHLTSLIAPRYGYAVVAETSDGQLVALANLMWNGTSAEIALLVEDAWQRHGLGSALLRRLLLLGERIGIREILLHTHPDNVGLIRVVNRLGLPVRRRYADGVLTLKMAVLIGATAG